MKKLINKKRKIFFINPIIFLLLSAFFLRIALTNTGTLSLDYNTFRAWSSIAANEGLKAVYNGWSDYLPGYMYVLWFLGKINNLGIIPEVILYKLPAILSDIILGFLIYKVARKYLSEVKSLLASSLFLFNPAIFANSAMWGQVDSLTALASFTSLMLLPSSAVVGSAIIFSIGVLIKPQALLIGPIIVLYFLKNKWPFRKVLLYGLVSVITLILLFVPFNASSSLPSFIFERFRQTMEQYPYSSINAFNIWGLGGFWQKETPIIQVLQILSLLLAYFIGFYKLHKHKAWEYKLAALIFVTGFLWMSRMHERHLLPSFPFLALSASFLPNIWIPYIILSLTYLANLRYAFVWIIDNFKEIFSDAQLKVLIGLNLGAYLLLLYSLLKEKTVNLLSLFKEEKVEKLPKLNLSSKRKKIILSVIIFFAFITRVINLQSPQNEYFDEVYHAFTARQLLHNDPKVWEWWNQSPEGFAYEWTHPPVAKLGMWVSMKVLGENAFAWRLPAALLGTFSVFLVYKIAKEIFKDEAIGLLSSGIFALDGLPLVMSRIGMNDMYFLSAVLLSFYLFIKDRYIFSSIFLGLAAASKWSTLWAIPVFFILHIILKKKINLRYIIYLFIPVLVYIASYIPMFTSGHDWDIFIGMQKQMWWYHTGLVATHPYTSPWWTWPFLFKPIWLYTSGESSGMITNIYATGNPIVFWFGVGSIITGVLVGIKERNKKILGVVAAYLVFFSPWALSPRIMFLYHYLPSIPFMAIAIGYIIRKYPKNIIPLFIIALVLFLYFFPRMIGLSVPTWLNESYFWFPSWR